MVIHLEVWKDDWAEQLESQVKQLVVKVMRQMKFPIKNKSVIQREGSGWIMGDIHILRVGEESHVLKEIEKELSQQLERYQDSTKPQKSRKERTTTNARERPRKIRT